MRNHRTCANHRPSTDGDSFQNNGMSTYPHVILYNDWSRKRSLTACTPMLPRYWVRVCIRYEYTPAYIDMITDADTRMHPNARRTHAHIVTHNERCVFLHMNRSVNVAANGIHPIARRKIEIRAYGYFATSTQMHFTRNNGMMPQSYPPQLRRITGLAIVQKRIRKAANRLGSLNKIFICCYFKYSYRQTIKKKSKGILAPLLFHIA